VIEVTATGRGWYTDRGLTVGSSEQMLRRLYPNAEMPSWSPGVYQMGPILNSAEEPSQATFGGFGLTALRHGIFLSAAVRAGKVVAITVENDIGD
jgi:hypothetical protein